MSRDVPLHIIHLEQDDPKKCSCNSRLCSCNIFSKDGLYSVPAKLGVRLSEDSMLRGNKRRPDRKQQNFQECPVPGGNV